MIILRVSNSSCRFSVAFSSVLSSSVTKGGDLRGRHLLQFLPELAGPAASPAENFVTSATIFPNVFVATILVGKASQKVFATQTSRNVGDFVFAHLITVIFVVLFRAIWAFVAAFFADRSGT